MRRFDTSSLVASLGALMLVVSLFLVWYEPDLTAWDAFEVWDLVLAGLALAVLAAGAAELGWWRGPVPTIATHLIGATAVVIVLASLIDQPPAAGGRGIRDGAWLGLAGAVLMLAGGVMSRVGIAVSLSLEPRPRRAGAGRAAGSDTAGRPAPGAPGQRGPGERAAAAEDRAAVARGSAGERPGGGDSVVAPRPGAPEAPPPRRLGVNLAPSPHRDRGGPDAFEAPPPAPGAGLARGSEPPPRGEPARGSEPSPGEDGGRGSEPAPYGDRARGSEPAWSRGRLGIDWAEPGRDEDTRAPDRPRARPAGDWSEPAPRAPAAGGRGVTPPERSGAHAGDATSGPPEPPRRRVFPRLRSAQTGEEQTEVIRRRPDGPDVPGER